MLGRCDKIVRRSVSLIGIALGMLLGNAQAQQVPIPQTAGQVPGRRPARP